MQLIVNRTQTPAEQNQPKPSEGQAAKMQQNTSCKAQFLKSKISLAKREHPMNPVGIKLFPINLWHSKQTVN